MKIKTITCHDVYNVGASLQAYALLTYLKKLGHEVEIIDYKPGYLSDRHKLCYIPNEKYRKNILLKYAYILCKMPQRLKELSKKNKFNNFHSENYILTDDTYRTNEELKLNPPIADVYFAGSDQIWNTLFENGKDPAFYLDFAPKQSIKASYAASFATEKIEDKYKNEVSKRIEDLNFIAVREKTGLNILESMNIKRGQCVVDPVFLLDKSFWNSKCKNENCEDEYLLVYDFEQNSRIEEISKYIAKKNNLKIWTVFKSKYADKQLKDVGPLEFITYIKNAKYILSNSFHGTAFSIIFNKEFYVIKRNEDINTRMQDLLSSINVSERLISSKEDLIKCKPLDYNSINNIMQNNVKKSKDYIDLVIKESEKRGEHIG